MRRSALGARGEAALHGPIGSHLLVADSEVYDGDGWYRVRTPSTPLPSLNEVVLSAVSSAAPEAAIDSVVAAYRAHQLPLKWSVYPWSEPPDLGERLLRKGAIRWHARGMVCDTSLDVAVPQGVSVERVDGPASLTFEAYLEVMAAGWEVPAAELGFLRAQLEHKLSERTPSWELFVVSIDGTPAGSAATFVKPDSGYLMGANVLPAFQGRGAYRALLRSRLDALRERGVDLATTQAREHTAAPMLEHFGLETVFRHTLYLLNPR